MDSGWNWKEATGIAAFDEIRGYQQRNKLKEGREERSGSEEWESG